MKDHNLDNRSLAFDSLFSSIKLDLKKLKEAVLKNLDISSILKEYEDDLKGADFR